MTLTSWCGDRISELVENSYNRSGAAIAALGFFVCYASLYLNQSGESLMHIPHGI
jgi:hypothetical protein